MSLTKDTAPQWVTLDRRALSGNILVTGSIGSGKTQGAILPLFEQILCKFEPTPCVLAIDPKGTFIQQALGAIERLGMRDRVLHLKLGGETKINPIFASEGLVGSGILDMANMIRVASANSGNQAGGSNSDFWEQSANNLVKNALIYCSAVYGYYTLNHLYRVILEAHSADLAGDLEKVLETKSLKPEEIHNICSAHRYLEQEFKELEDKVRTSVLTTATCFLNQFQEFQASQIFCPEQNEITVHSFDEIVDQGKIVLFDVSSPALARSMGTFVKLLYQRSLLNRLNSTGRDKSRLGVLIIDEYQDVVSSAGNGMLGDDGYFAKAREANTASIVASQSLTSIENGVRKERVARELFQNFRTRVAFHSSDLSTIRSFQELIGQEDTKKVSHSVSEYSQHAKRNLVAGTFESKDANISESVNTSDHKEYSVTAKEFARLKTFEAFAQVYDGVETRFLKLYAKPFFLKDKRTSHRSLINSLRTIAASVTLFMFSAAANAFPSVCSAIRTPEFRSCLKYEVGACTCGYPPRPCAQISYYIPKTFVETFPDPKESFFKGLPAASAQMGALPLGLPFGAEADGDTQTFQAHVLSAPFVGIPFSLLSCGSSPVEKTCFEGMSEHLGSAWTSGVADTLQPNFLAWSLAPKACLLKGAATSLTGEPNAPSLSASLMCSAQIGLPRFPPSTHSACNGWGVFFPRTGVYQGGSQTAGALMVASRMRSISAEVLKASSTSPDEYWQMLTPQSSSCFKEGQNVGMLETVKNVHELGRFAGSGLKGHLFSVWEKVSCCRDLTQLAADQAALGLFQGVCQGL